jgi:hypothetical protein
MPSFSYTRNAAPPTYQDEELEQKSNGNEMVKLSYSMLVSDRILLKRISRKTGRFIPVVLSRLIRDEADRLGLMD